MIVTIVIIAVDTSSTIIVLAIGLSRPGTCPTIFEADFAAAKNEGGQGLGFGLGVGCC